MNDRKDTNEGKCSHRCKVKSFFAGQGSWAGTALGGLTPYLPLKDMLSPPPLQKTPHHPHHLLILPLSSRKAGVKLDAPSKNNYHSELARKKKRAAFESETQPFHN